MYVFLKQPSRLQGISHKMLPDRTVTVDFAAFSEIVPTGRVRIVSGSKNNSKNNIKIHI